MRSTILFHTLTALLMILGTMGLTLACDFAANSEYEAVTSTTEIVRPTGTEYPVYIRDSLGRSIKILDNPERIVAFDSATVEILFALGSGEVIVGTHNFVAHPPESETIPRVGDAFNLDVEKIVSLNPDLFVTFLEAPIAILEQLDIPVLYLGYPKSLDDVPARIRLWGQIVDRSRQADLLASDFENDLIENAKYLRMITQGPRIFHDVGELWTPGDDTFVDTIYDFLKAKNIADGLKGWAQMSQEQIIEQDPEVIILAYPEGPSPFSDKAAFGLLTAVQNGRVHHIDPDLLSIPGPRIILGLNKLVKFLYPTISNNGSAIYDAY